MKSLYEEFAVPLYLRVPISICPRFLVPLRFGRKAGAYWRILKRSAIEWVPFAEVMSKTVQKAFRRFSSTTPTLGSLFALSVVVEGAK